MSIALIAISFIAVAGAFLFAVTRLFSTQTIERGEGDIIGSTVSPGDFSDGDGGGD